MASIGLDVNGRRYTLGCDDGEEERLSQLGERLDARVRALADQFGQIGDQRLLLMASLTLMDEYDELAGNMEAQAESLVSDIQREAENTVEAATRAQVKAADAMDAMAKRVESVLAGLPDG